MVRSLLLALYALASIIARAPAQDAADVAPATPHFDAAIAGEALRANTVSFDGLGFQDVVAEPRMADGVLTFADCRARAYGGAVAATIAFDLEHHRQNYRIDLRGADLGLFLRSFAAVESGQSGTVDGWIDLAITGGDGDARTMTGRGELRVHGGDLLRMPALANLLVGDPGDSHGHDEAVAHFEIADGRMRLRGTRITAPGATISIRGTIGLDGDLDLVVVPTAGFKGLTAVPGLGDLAAWALGAASSRIARARVRGTVKNPVVSLNPFAK